MKDLSIQYWLSPSKSGIRHLGVDFARSLSSFKRTKWLGSAKTLLLILLFQTIGIIGWLGLKLELNYKAVVDIFIVGATLFSNLILFPFVSLQSFKKSKSRRINLDLVVCFFIVFFSLWSIRYQPILLDELFFLQCFGSLFILTRTFEACLQIHSRNRNQIWTLTDSFYQELKKHESRFFGISFALGSLVYSLAILLFVYLGFKLPTYPALILSALPLFLPSSAWIYSRLAFQFSRFGVQLNRFFLLFKLRRGSFLRFHHFGVLTGTQYEDIEYYFDPSSAWDEDLIRELLANLVHSSVHPISRAIEKSLGVPSRSSWDVENLPYVGLRSSFRTPDGKKHELVLGNLHWMKTHQHGLSTEMLKKAESWNADQRLSSFVSIDSRLVAGISVKTQRRTGAEKALRWLKTMGFRMALWSSSSKESIGDWDGVFDDEAKDLLPLEREIQSYYWSERSKDLISIHSAWDTADEGIRIVFHEDQHQALSPHEIQIISGEIFSLPFLFQEASIFRKNYRIARYLPAILCLLLLCISFFSPWEPAVLSAAVFLASYIILAFYFHIGLSKDVVSSKNSI